MAGKTSSSVNLPALLERIWPATDLEILHLVRAHIGRVHLRIKPAAVFIEYLQGSVIDLVVSQFAAFMFVDHSLCFNELR